MTRDEAKRLLPFIQAYAEGKTIQINDSNKGWMEAFNPEFKPSYLYRLKPEPRDYWAVKDSKGGIEVYEVLGEAEHKARWGVNGPYTIHHMREVI